MGTMKSALHRSTVGLAALLVACQAVTPVVDRRPEFVPLELLRSTVWVGSVAGEGAMSSGSAVIVGPHQLLTAAHVWAPHEEWREGLPEERELSFCTPSLIALRADPGASLSLKGVPAFTHSRFRLLAAGTPEVQDPANGGTGPRIALGDWVLIETDDTLWDPDDAAQVHPAALDKDWRVPDGSELLVAGFSSIFLPEGSHDDQGVLDLGAHLEFVLAGPYTIRGQASSSVDLPGLEYPTDWPRPGGHSGGGVYLWDEREREPKLIGVFHSKSGTQVTATVQFRLLGLDSLAFDLKRDRKGALLSYDPVAPAFAAMQRDAP